MKKITYITAVLASAMMLWLTSCTKIKRYEGYKLLWHDEFNGKTLDDKIWNREIRPAGWTNHELQAYTESDENIYVEDGKLVLRAVQKTLKSGKHYYTSGKVQTSNKKDFTYGRVCVRAKAPKGKGLWPAIWMMPTKEKYGNWPVCGEIDIMEVLGNEPEKTYGTIHYGAPHGQKQGTYILSGDSFADSFHEFSVEWEPGKFRWYIDDILFYEENNWFAKSRGGEDFDYPAPFDQDFYIQLNLAVGGDWPGKPDDSTDFEKAKFEIDYVRVYQKKHYDTNVERPTVKFPEPDAKGNYVHNGTFEKQEPLDGSANWIFLTAGGGQGGAQIKDSQMIITTTNYGGLDYSIQLVHPGIGHHKGKHYRINFDAKADGNRTLKVAVTAPEVNWIRYFYDTPVDLTANWKTYTFEYEMKDADDPLARLEFNMGNQKSKDTIYLKNVEVIELD